MMFRYAVGISDSREQLFRLSDRKGGKYLLSPTYEEEMTALVGNIVKSYKELPLRLYQICMLLLSPIRLPWKLTSQLENTVTSRDPARVCFGHENFS